MSSSRGSSQPRDRICSFWVSSIAGRFLSKASPVLSCLCTIADYSLLPHPPWILLGASARPSVCTSCDEE